MSNRVTLRRDPSESLDKVLDDMTLSNPAEGFSDRVISRLMTNGNTTETAERKHTRIPAEWKNGFVAAAATLVFVASEIPAKIATVSSWNVGIIIQDKVLFAVNYGMEWIRMM